MCLHQRRFLTSSLAPRDAKYEAREAKRDDAKTKLIAATKDPNVDAAALRQLTETTKKLDELYDLEKDPFEIQNLSKRASYKPVKEKLQRELKKLTARENVVGFTALHNETSISTRGRGRVGSVK